MKKYIDSSFVEYLIDRYGGMVTWNKKEILGEIKRNVQIHSTADVVEVVRCEKCSHKVDFKGRVMCNRNARKINEEWCGLTATDNNHFCSYGERKDT